MVSLRIFFFLEGILFGQSKNKPNFYSLDCKSEIPRDQFQGACLQHLCGKVTGKVID